MYNNNNLVRIKNSLVRVGLKGDALKLALTQVAHETGDFNSKVFISDNNATGIMFINNGKKQKNATKGKAFPSKEGNYFYAKFNTLDDWARDFLRIVENSLNKAKDVKDYAYLLKNQGYFTDSINNYLKGLTYHYNNLLNGGFFNSVKNNKGKLFIIIIILFLIIK